MTAICPELEFRYIQSNTFDTSTLTGWFSFRPTRLSSVVAHPENECPSYLFTRIQTPSGLPLGLDGMYVSTKKDIWLVFGICTADMKLVNEARACTIASSNAGFL